MKTYLKRSSKETQKFAEWLAQKICSARLFSGRSRRAKSALILALSGELGSGKTTFVQGFLRGFGIRKRSPSPTFIIFRRFALRGGRFANLYHVDAYRIKHPRELAALGIKEIFSDPKNIVLVEWADKIKKLLPKDAVRIKFSHGNGAEERKIKILLKN